MRIAVIGGTGIVGSRTVEALQRAGHDTIVVARAWSQCAYRRRSRRRPRRGRRLHVTNVQAPDVQTTRNLFAAATRNLLAAEQRAQVRHHVLLSIVGVDRLEGNAHYAGKLMQEALLSSGPVPFTIQRATQFHEFAAQVVGWTRVGQVAIVPPLLVQPVAAADVGDVLAEIAAGVPGPCHGPCRTRAAGLGRHGRAHAVGLGGVDPADPELAEWRLWSGGGR
jgi:uncharacterized protein YbjT (DUF2867 family)